MENNHQQDAIARKLRGFAQNILVLIFGLLPILFVPTVAAPFGYSKTFLVIIGIFVGLILFGLSVLRSGIVRGGVSWTLAAFWLVAFVTAVAALLSGDVRDAFLGHGFDVHTALFVGLLALIGSVWALFGADKMAVMRLYILLAVSTLVLVVFHVLRVLIGADTISLGLFQSATASPIGGWNDLAIFFGLAIILSLVALEQLSMTTWGRALFAVVTAGSLVMLAIINFFAVWIVLGLISLMVLIYALSKDRFIKSESLFGGMGKERSSSFSTISLVMSLVVLAVSVVFILGGPAISNAISRAVDINYIEVRPSFSATTNVIGDVYNTQALFGIGPNRFADAWRLHKDPSINQSIFWNTDFVAGSGYIPTFFATAGILGGLFWLLFLGVFIYTGLRMLIRSAEGDRMWYFIGTSSFVSGLYLWGIALIYVPGPVLLMLAAMCTGLVIAAHTTLARGGVPEFNVAHNRRSTFVLVAVVILLILGSVSALYFTGRHYASVYTYNQSLVALQQGADIETVEAITAEAYALSQDDRFARRMAEYQLARLSNLLSIQEPTEAQQAEFQSALESGISAAQIAIQLDGTESRNWSVLGNLYASLVPAGIEGAYDRAEEALKRAQELDPHNPARTLELAQLAFAAGTDDVARERAQQALSQKPNYTDAIFFISQVEIARGNIDEALAAAQAVTMLEPQNAVRFLQLGLLLYSEERYTEAASVFERALQIDPQYANGHYFLALTYDQLDRPADARGELEAILETNPGNELVQQLLDRLDNGQSLVQVPASQTVEEGPVDEEEAVNTEDGAVTSDEASDTPLVTPVNTTGESE